MNPSHPEWGETVLLAAVFMCTTDEGINLYSHLKGVAALQQEFPRVRMAHLYRLEKEAREVIQVCKQT
jgi:hypothetical protein